MRPPETLHNKRNIMQNSAPSGSAVIFHPPKMCDYSSSHTEATPESKGNTIWSTCTLPAPPLSPQLFWKTQSPGNRLSDCPGYQLSAPWAAFMSLIHPNSSQRLVWPLFHKAISGLWISCSVSASPCTGGQVDAAPAFFPNHIQKFIPGNSAKLDSFQVGISISQ